MSLADKIIKNVKALPESKQIEILDFIEPQKQAHSPRLAAGNALAFAVQVTKIKIG